MSSWASFQRRYEKLTAELRKETSESQRKQLSSTTAAAASAASAVPNNSHPVSVVVNPVVTLYPSDSRHINPHPVPGPLDHRPLTPSPSPSEVTAGDARATGPHVTSLHVHDLTTSSQSATPAGSSIFTNQDTNHPKTNNNINSTSPSPGSLLTPPTTKSSPSPNESSDQLSSANPSNSSPSIFTRSYFTGRFSLGKAGIGYRSLGLPQFLANLSIGSSYASNTSISTEKPDGARRTSTSSVSGSSDPVSASEVVKTAETVNRIMDTQCLSPRPVRPRPKDLRGLGAMGGSGRSSGRLRQDLSFLPTVPRSINPSHHRHSPSNQQDRDDSMRLSNKFPSNNSLTIDGQEYSISEQDFDDLGLLGSGSSGNVARMRHKPTGRVIAVKMMRRNGNDDDTKRIGMDLDILLKCGNCDHIVQCHGYMIKDVDVWICMELMSSCFEKLLKQGTQFPEPILGKVSVATVKALHYLKEHHKVIHRDVKPSNILINSSGNIKLCDFGISGRLVDSKAKTRQAGCTAYLAPERIQPEDPASPTYDVRADVWSLGITLVELALQEFPYKADSDFEVLSKIMNDPPPGLPDNRFTPQFCDFVRLCLMKESKFRPKYKKLLEHAFIRQYEEQEVDVAAWFASTQQQQ